MARASRFSQEVRGAIGADGLRAPGRVRVPVGGDLLDRREDRMFPGDAPEVGAADRGRLGSPGWRGRARRRLGSRNSSARSASFAEPMRSFAKRRRISPRRSSTADRGDGVVHRRASRGARGRADLQKASDRPVDLLRAEGPRGGPPLGFRLGRFATSSSARRSSGSGRSTSASTVRAKSGVSLAEKGSKSPDVR